MSEHARQRGVALISVLLITALVTLIISDMLARQRLSLASSANQLHQQQLWQLALSGEALARQRLHEELGKREERCACTWARAGHATRRSNSTAGSCASAWKTSPGASTSTPCAAATARPAPATSAC